MSHWRVALGLGCAVLLAVSGQAGGSPGTDDRDLERQVARMAGQIQTLTDQMKELRTELNIVRLESAAVRIARLNDDLRTLAAARRELEAREAARAQELAEAEQYIAEASPQGGERESAETMRLELAVTRPAELAQEHASLDSREIELRTRLVQEERERTALRRALETAAPSTNFR